MKMNKKMGLALIAALIAGSALAGVKEAQRSSDSLKATQTEVQDAYNQITATIGSLGTLMSAQVGDLGPMLKDFSAQVKQLQSDAESAKARALSMQAKNKEYFAAWAQEIAAIADPAIKAQSQQRLQESFASYQKVEQGLVQTRDAYVPLMSSLNDLQTALNQDLSPAGKAGLQPSFAKVREQAVAAQGAMQATKAAIQAALGGLTPRASGIVM
jgi:hypothetical protein